MPYPPRPREPGRGNPGTPNKTAAAGGQVTFRATAEDAAALRRLAELHPGLNQTELVRLALRRAAGEEGRSTPRVPAAPTPKGND